MNIIIQAKIGKFNYWYDINGKISGLIDNACKFRTKRAAENRLSVIKDLHPKVEFKITNI